MSADLDARYSALCDAVRAHPDVPAELRAEITASAHLAGVVYAGGAAPLRGRELAVLGVATSTNGLDAQGGAS